MNAANHEGPVFGESFSSNSAHGAPFTEELHTLSAPLGTSHITIDMR